MNKYKKKFVISIIFLVIVFILTLYKIVHEKESIESTLSSNTQSKQDFFDDEINENMYENQEIIQEVLDEDVKVQVEKNVSQEEVVEEENIVDIQTAEIIVEQENIVPDETNTAEENAFENGNLTERPNYADKYANLIISKIGVNAPIFFGADEQIILRGVGHESDSYFPGENGSIVMCGHNYMNNFKNLEQLEYGDIIEIKTSYGDFYYQLYDAQVVLETERYKLPIQKDEERLMIYTCYPANSTGHTPYRYVVYANKI